MGNEPHTSSGDSERIELPAYLFDVIAKANRLDMELYNYALEEFARRRRLLSL